MNIDIRNPRRNAIEGIEKVKRTFDIKTNSEAVQIACSRYMSERESGHHWKIRAMNAEKELNDLRNGIKFIVKQSKKGV